MLFNRLYKHLFEYYFVQLFFLFNKNNNPYFN